MKGVGVGALVRVCVCVWEWPVECKWEFCSSDEKSSLVKVRVCVSVCELL